MRYLNKIVFIESAKIKYAEVAIDGNVHFIGTQGVGKSTVLRAILFFYNADKIRLGIEKSKFSFDEYYFPLGNSYIIYEIIRETGPFCILAYKSQGRACFRFIDGAYHRDNYLDSNSRPMEWEGIRASLTQTGNRYSRKIDRYEDYRDILYGNNRGLDADLRKYAIIESRQYQNIPRTIQNVFLNSKLDAEFIKQTIIMSLNEEDVKISLDNYTLHLRDFDTQLADITKWTEKNKSGDIPVRIQAEAIARLHAQIRFLEQEKREAATALFQTYEAEKLELPEFEKKLVAETEKHRALTKKLAELDGKFQSRREEIQRLVNNLDSDLKRARQKSQEYEIMNITGIIQRVLKKPDVEKEQGRLLEERDLLTSKFKDINARYEALIIQQQTGLDRLKNDYHARKNYLQDKLITYKTEVDKEYKMLYEEIRQQFRQSLETTRALVTQKSEKIYEVKLNKQKVQLERFFEKEIDVIKDEITVLKQRILNNSNTISDSKKQAENWQKQWELDTEKGQTVFARRKERIQEQTGQITRNIAAIDGKLEKNKDSLYGWLSAHVPGWEKTIGKVIDEEDVLFHASLSPQLTGHAADTLFGVRIDLDEITKTVKTVSDYQQEKLKLHKRIETNDVALNTLSEQEKEDADKLKRRYQPKIKELKDAGYQAEYALAKAKEELLENEVALNDMIAKAAREKAEVLAQIDLEMVTAQQELAYEQESYNTIETNLQKQLDTREREQKKKIKAEEQRIAEVSANLDLELRSKNQEVSQRIEELKKEQTSDLVREGADTNRIADIENALDIIRKELEFIETNRDHVADYNKDKRELFDHVDRFKTEKRLKEALLENEKGKHFLQREKLTHDIAELGGILDELNQRIAAIHNGLRAFQEFQATESFTQISAYANHSPKALKDRKDLKKLIENVIVKIYALKDRYVDLQAAVNKFLSNFSVNNIFGFKTDLIEREDFILFSEMLYTFLEEDKIAEYEQRVNERFATLIRQIGKETTELVSKEGDIQKVITEINRDFEERNFAGVIKSIKLQLSGSQNKIVALLLEIKRFNDDHAMSLGVANLFSPGDRETQNKKAIDLLKEFAKEIGNRKESEISLSDSFELQFRIVENDNDSHWVEKLANVGSEGTDILVKAMINIMLLNVFKENASRKFKDFRLHCMMDEIGKLHPNNVKGILKFANDRNILLINSSPTSYNATDYRYTYLLSKDARNITTVKRLIKKGD